MLSTNLSRADVINRIARLYGLELLTQLPTTKGYRNESHPLRLTDCSMANIILYKDEPDIVRTIRNANRVSDFLMARGFPTRQTLDARILRISIGHLTKYAALYSYLPGETISWEAYTQKHIKLLGKAMSDMHASLRSFDTSGLPDVVKVYLAICDRMQQYFDNSDVSKALAKKLNLLPPDPDKFVTVLKYCRRLPDQQVLHMDFVRGNILFSVDVDKLKISGILDFEKTGCGHPLFDIARTLAFLLVDCKHKSHEKVHKYFLRSGYQKRGTAVFKNTVFKTKTADIDVLESLVDLFLLHDFYKFLAHNPYESLPGNEHFIRTRDILLQRHLLRRVSQ